MEAAGVEDTNSPASGRVDSPTVEDLATAATARGRSRTTAVAGLATGSGEVLAEVVIRLARVIEATARIAPWSGSVKLAPGFAEEAARSAIGALTAAKRTGRG